VLIIMSTQNSDDDHMLAAEYVIGVLEKSERDAFVTRIAKEPTLAASVKFWEEHFAILTDDIPSVAPPSKLQTKLNDRLFGATTATQPSFLSILAFWRGLAIASLVGVIALGGWNLRAPTEQPALIAQVAGDKNLVKLAAFYDEAKGELRLNRTEGTAPSGRSFELWLIAGQDAPVSLGVLPDATTTRLTVPVALRGKLAKGVLAISDEPQGGSTTGAPTGDVLATGQLTTI
jgi:anti-sigma-K factor RskA